MTRCDVCNGTKTVRLPVLQNSVSSAGGDAYKSFPCPQCGDVAPYKDVICIRTTDPLLYEDQDVADEITESLKETTAHLLVDFALKHDLIRFESSPRGMFQGDVLQEMHASMSVVAPIDADRIEAEIKRRAFVAAEKMLLETINEVVMRIDTTSGFSEDEKPMIKQRIYHATDATRARWRKTEGKT